MKPADVAKALPAGMRAQFAKDRRAMVSAAHLGAEIVASRAPVDAGIVKSSVHVEAQTDGARIVIDAPHVGIVELGSRPHMPPLQPLIDWVKRHGRALGIRRARTRNAQGHSTESPEVVQFARALQQKIAREGTKPTYWIRKSLPLLARAFAAELARGAGGTLQDGAAEAAE